MLVTTTPNSDVLFTRWGFQPTNPTEENYDNLAIVNDKKIFIRRRSCIMVQTNLNKSMNELDFEYLQKGHLKIDDIMEPLLEMIQDCERSHNLLTLRVNQEKLTFVNKYGENHYALIQFQIDFINEEEIVIYCLNALIQDDLSSFSGKTC
jgi:flagellar hook protein FlgE